MAEQILKTTFQLKRGNSADWQKVNPVLRVGEPGFETDTGRLKIGDGSTEWNALKYVGECGSGVINAETHFDFPSVGDVNFIYKAEKEKKIYQWNSTSLIYEVISDESGLDDIEIINGGNANGTN